MSKEFSEAFIHTVAEFEGKIAKIIKQAYLTNVQRTDLESILNATQEFQRYVQAEQSIIDNPEDSHEADVQRVRHQLLNHLNIIVGFTRIMMRDLPDNLLLHMITIRDINETGQMLIDRVNTIR